MTSRRVVACSLCCCLLLLVGCGVGTAAGSNTDPFGQQRGTWFGPWEDPTTTDAAVSEITVTRTLQLTPNRPGEIRVVLDFEIPDNAVSVEPALSSSAVVTGSDGFVSRSDGLVWDGHDPSPTITYRLPVNETREQAGPLAGQGSYLFADVGDWALVRIPQVAVSRSWNGQRQMPVRKTTTVAGEGAVGQAIAYLGPHTEHAHTAAGQTFRLIEPVTADLGASPSGIFDSLAHGADELRVGDRDRSVFMIAAPTTAIEWAVQGLQTGDADLWVRDFEPLDDANNVWLHEYVHTRQQFRPDESARWFTEASAAYYAALLTLEHDRIGFEAFRQRLSLGTRESESSAVLTKPATWTEMTPYLRGALVAGELDRQTRLATDGATLQSVFRRLNTNHGALTDETFQSAIGEVGGVGLQSVAERYTATTAVPAMWGKATHERIFDTAFPRIEYGFRAEQNASGFRVSGDYRSGPIGGQRPLHLATGERLRMDLVVRNAGGAAGTYDATIDVAGETIGHVNGRLEPNESVVRTLSHTFEQPGEYTVAANGVQVGVSVSEPALPRVTNLMTNQSRVTVGQPLAVTATVENNATVPAVGPVTLTADDASVATRETVLTPGESRTLTFVHRPAEAGTVSYESGDRSTAVRVTQRATATATPPATRGVGDGLNVVATVLALAVLAGFATLRVRQSAR